MNEPIKELCVVHLVRAHNGIEPFKNFLESYRGNPGGMEHDLLIVFKGFDQPKDIAVYRELLAPYRHVTFEISDEGFDITAYFAAVNRYSDQHRYFCFLNSHSVILDHDWLKKLHENMTKPGVGLVGATGSWQSLRGNLASWRLPIIAVILHYRQHDKKWGLKGIVSQISSIWKRSCFLMKSGRFPNYHLRTNAFMISGESMKKIDSPSIKTKMDAYNFESGKKGLTQQILKNGKKVILVGKDGVGYEKECWRESKIFWQSDQENLLVADNKTCDYQEGSSERRTYLSSIAWGETGPGNDNG